MWGRKVISWEGISVGSNIEYQTIVKATKQRLWKWKENIADIEQAGQKRNKLSINFRQSAITESGPYWSSVNPQGSWSLVCCTKA